MKHEALPSYKNKLAPSINLFLRTILCVVFISLSSCEYELDKIKLTEIDYDISDITLNFEGSQDTIIVYSVTKLAFDLDLGAREIVSYDAFINSDILPNAIKLTSNGNYLELDTKQYSDGYHTVSMLFIVESGSGSYADQLNSEFLTIQLSQVIFINNIPVSPLQVVEQKIVDGALQISWNKYRGYGFEAYTIDNCDGFITDVNDTTISICNYYGGKLNLRLGLRARGQFPTSFFIYEDDLDVNISESEEQIIIQWQPSPYFSNFQYYEISVSDLTRNLSWNTQTIRDINQTRVALDRPGFPSSYSVYGTAFGKEFFQISQIGDIALDVGAHLGIIKIKILENSDFLVLKKTYDGKRMSLVKFDGSTGEKLNEIEGVVDVSNDGSEIITYSNGVISKISPETFQVTNAYPTNQLNEFGVNLDFILIKSPQRVLVRVIESSGIRVLKEFDLVENRFINSYGQSFELLGSSISDDGRYLFSLRNITNPATFIYDLELDTPINDEDNGSRTKDAYFLPKSNRLLKFDEPLLYSINMDGNDRIDLGINKSDFDIFYSLDGVNMIAYKDQQNSFIHSFNANNGSNLSQVAKLRYASIGSQKYLYSISGDRLLALLNDNIYLRKLE